MTLPQGKTQGYTQLIYKPDKCTWTTAFSNDIRRLAQGVGNRVKGTINIFSSIGQYYQKAREQHMGGLLSPSGPTKSKPTGSALLSTSIRYHMRSPLPQNVQVSSQPRSSSMVWSQQKFQCSCARTYMTSTTTPQL